jgi:hypothetical protein
MNIEVRTSEYEFSHGKKPKGSGHWAFYMGSERDTLKAHWFVGKYSEAKKQALAKAQELGVESITVGS